MTFTRQTLAGEVTLNGRGLHSGVPVRVTVHPGEYGIRFMLGHERLSAVPSNVSDTTRSTSLGPVRTIEHLMSAFAGVGITDADVELTAPELPGMDGSAKPFVEAILGAGIATLGERTLRDLFKRVYEKDGSAEIAIARGDGHWRYLYDVGDRWPGRQEVDLDVAQYAAEIAPARTFCLEEELPMIQAHGLGQGLDESSCLVLGSSGPVNTARMPDEPARHKLLDVIGDLYLAGVPPRFLSVVAGRSGHRVNVAAAHKLRQFVEGG